MISAASPCERRLQDQLTIERHKTRTHYELSKQQTNTNLYVFKPCMPVKFMEKLTAHNIYHKFCLGTILVVLCRLCRFLHVMHSMYAHVM
jgi:hypothetical protein